WTNPRMARCCHTTPVAGRPGRPAGGWTPARPPVAAGSGRGGGDPDPGGAVAEPSLVASPDGRGPVRRRRRGAPGQPVAPGGAAAARTPRRRRGPGPPAGPRSAAALPDRRRPALVGDPVGAARHRQDHGGPA